MIEHRSWGLDTQTGQDWRDDAACRPGSGVDPDEFFPIGNSAASFAQIARAKEVCGSCPVRSDCLRWALDTGMTDGVWGGTSAYERRVMRAQGAKPYARSVLCRKGLHELTPHNVYTNPKTGKRCCRACRAIAAVDAREQRQLARAAP